MDINKRLLELGIELPEAPDPIASYVPNKISGNMVYLAGQGPSVNGKFVYTGKVGDKLTKEEGYEAARISGLNLLAQLKKAVGDLNRVKQIVSVHGYVASTNDFFEQPAVINGTSDLLVEVFGEAGKHARVAMGTNVLPMDTPVEVELIAEIKD